MAGEEERGREKEEGRERREEGSCWKSGAAGTEGRCWETVKELFPGIRAFYYKEIAVHFQSPVTFIYFNVQKFLFHLEYSPIIPLQKSHSAHFCQSSL